MTHPYHEHAKPPGPPPPPRFSPLRPLRVLAKTLGRWLWWWLLAPMSEVVVRRDALAATRQREPTGFGCFVAVLMIWCLLDTVAYGGASIGWWEFSTPWLVYVVGVLTLLRAWLPAAMHLDEPESYAWWSERLS